MSKKRAKSRNYLKNVPFGWMGLFEFENFAQRISPQIIYPPGPRPNDMPPEYIIQGVTQKMSPICVSSCKSRNQFLRGVCKPCLGVEVGIVSAADVQTSGAWAG